MHVHVHDHDDHGHDDHGHGHGHHGHGHGHGHGHHGHGHHHHGGAAGALQTALLLNGLFLGIEAGVGWWTGSLALLSDALHMTSDVAALLVALGATRLAARAATSGTTFGLRRFETLGALVNGLALFVATALIVREAVERLVIGAPVVDGMPVLVVGGIGLAINLGSAWALWRADRNNLNVRGALAHMLADALGSLGAMIAAVALMFGFPIADPIVSLLVAALVAWGAWQVTREASRILLQLPPPGFDVEALVHDLRGVAGVAAVHDVHVWTLDGRDAIVTAHLVAAPDADPRVVVDAVQELAHQRYGVHHGTFQVETDGEKCGLAACGAH